MAEAFLRRKLATAGLSDVSVGSAGLLESGRSPTDDGIETMATWGIDLGEHRSRQMTDEMLRAADLVIGMAREHVREVAVNVPDVWPRTFTMREFIRRGEEIGPRAPGQPFDEWVAKLHAGRIPSSLLGSSEDDDVADPMGRSRRAYETSATEIDALTTRLVALIFGEASQ
jgi:protein-tyrosine phosphatase